MNSNFLSGLVLDDNSALTLEEFSSACCAQEHWIIELVDEGILEPSGGDISQWLFTGSSLPRARIVRRLQRDLGINIAGAALVLNLMEEVEDLRTQLYVLECGEL